MKRSYERINNLNFFETVDIIPKPQPEEKLVDLDIKVKERPTGMLSIGGGYSSVDKLIGMVEITQGNLFGKGQLLKIKGEFGGRTTYYEINFKEPWFMDQPILFSTSIYKSIRDYIQYSKKATGFGFSFGKDFSEYVKGEVEYNFEDATIYNVSKNASIVITEQEGTNTTSRITPFLVRDSRDNYLDPSRGSRNSIYLTYAGIGGTNNFVKSEIDSAWFFPLGKTAFMLRGRFGLCLRHLGQGITPLREILYRWDIHDKGIRLG